MLKSKENRKKVQPSSLNDPESNPLPKSDELTSQPNSPTVNHKKSSRASAMHLSPTGINLVNLQEGGAGKSNDSTRKNPDGTSSIRGSHRRQGGGSILKKSRLANPSDSTNRSENPPHERNRKHKISFKENIEQINVVENWKEYNGDDYAHNATCYCQLF